VLGAVILINVFLYYFSMPYWFQSPTSSAYCYLVIAVVVISLGYSYFAAYYRESAREMKRLDSSLRSLLYSHFAESLSGLATIRAYGETKRFISDDHYFIDLENRALYLTITNQASPLDWDSKSELSIDKLSIALVVGSSGPYGRYRRLLCRHNVCSRGQRDIPFTNWLDPFVHNATDATLWDANTVRVFSFVPTSHLADTHQDKAQKLR